MSNLDTEWRAREFRRAKDKQKLKLAQQGHKNEMEKMKFAQRGLERMQKNKQMYETDTARQQSVNDFYDQRRMENLVEARGYNDPLVQMGISTSSQQKKTKSGSSTKSGSDEYKPLMGKDRADTLNKYVEFGKTPEQAEAIVAQEDAIRTAFNVSDKQISPIAKKTQTYQGTIRRGAHKGSKGQEYKYFTDNPGASPQGLQGKLSKFKTHRLSPPEKPSLARIPTTDEGPKEAVSQKIPATQTAQQGNLTGEGLNVDPIGTLKNWWNTQWANAEKNRMKSPQERLVSPAMPDTYGDYGDAGYSNLPTDNSRTARKLSTGQINARAMPNTYGDYGKLANVSSDKANPSLTPTKALGLGIPQDDPSVSHKKQVNPMLGSGYISEPPTQGLVGEAPAKNARHKFRKVGVLGMMSQHGNLPEYGSSYASQVINKRRAPYIRKPKRDKSRSKERIRRALEKAGY